MHPIRGMTPLHFAVKYAGVDLVKQLLQAGADPSLRCTIDVDEKENEKIKEVLKKRNNYHPPQRVSGFTALDLAISSGDINKVNLILQHIKTVHINNCFFTPIECAEIMGHEDVAARLREVFSQELSAAALSLKK